MMTNKRNLAYIALGLGGLVLTYLVINQLLNGTNGTLKLTVIPKDATVVIDKGWKSKSRGYSLKPGTHTMTVARRGFVTKVEQVIITSKTTQNRVVLLTGQPGPDYNKWAAANPKQILEAQGLEGKNAAERGQKAFEKFPLLAFLPYRGQGYIVTYGAINQDPNTGEVSVDIVIKTDTEAGRANGRNWIKAQGYNLEDYTISYAKLQ
jgi:hypothetical protein